MRQAARLVVTVAALGLLVTGCTDDPAPVETTAASTPSPTPSPSATPSPVPTPAAATLPARPEAMSTPSADGAAAAATYFMTALYPYAYATGDTAEWESMSAPECRLCSGFRDKVAEMVTSGETIDSGSITVDYAFGTEIRADEWYSAELQINQGEATRRDATGTVVSTSPGGRFRVAVAMTWADTWIIDAVDIDPVDA